MLTHPPRNTGYYIGITIQKETTTNNKTQSLINQMLKGKIN
jgi:hypothetical protein